MPRATISLENQQHGGGVREPFLRRPLVQFEIQANLADTQDTWNMLHRRAGASPYQSFSWFSAWCDEIGTPAGWRPCIVIIHDEAGEPLLILPLVERRRFGLTLIEFGGGKHSNLNMPLMTERAASRLDRSTLSWLALEIARSRRGLVVLRLVNMPSHWHAMPNPLIGFAKQRSPGDSYAATLDDGKESWKDKLLSHHRRQRLNYNMRKLAESGELRWLTSDETECERMINAFLRQKGDQLARQGIPNPFRDPGFRRFIRRASTSSLAEIDPVIELRALELDGEIIATLGCAVAGKSFSVMFMSMCAFSAAARFSPGELLLWRVIEEMHARGFRRFDLGIGEAPHKARFCPEVVPLFDVFLAFSAGGQLIANALKIVSAGKGWVKRHPQLLSAARNLSRISWMREA